MKKTVRIAAVLIALLLCLSACGAPQNDSGNSGKQNESGNSVVPPDNTVDPGKTEPEPDDGTGRWAGSDYISVRCLFDSKAGDLELIMTGLTEASAAAVLEELKAFDPASGTAVKIVHDDIPDAEKWNCDPEADEDTFDSNQCWAASAANMLWISGWTKGLNDPRTGKPFPSEDAVFEYYNERFTDRGCEVSRALDWFFTGEYAPDWNNSHPAMLINDPDPADGLIKEFGSFAAQRHYDLIRNLQEIAQLEKTDMRTDFPAVFQGSIGELIMDTLYISEHSVTIAGIILDPAADAAEDRYKGIIIINSDNDGRPSQDYSATMNWTLEQKYADKEARPDSCTAYPLRISKDAEGTRYWEIVGYGSSPESEAVALFSINELPLPSELILNSCREGQGSRSVFDDPDLVPGLLFTTSNTESIMDPYYFDEESVIKTVFKSGDPINLNFFISNRSYKDLDASTLKVIPLIADWGVRNSAGELIARGTINCTEPIPEGGDAGYLVELNVKDGQLQSWPAGKYTVGVTFNTDHRLKEAYYTNNYPIEFEFSVE